MLNGADTPGLARRGGRGAQAAPVVPAISGSSRDADWRKELKRRVGEPGFTQPSRSMSAIGG